MQGSLRGNKGPRIRYVADLFAKVHPGLPEELEGGATKSWDEDPFQRGAYVVFNKGELSHLPAVIRRRYSDSLASLCLSHGSPSKADNLLECYANKPFGKLHDHRTSEVSVLSNWPVYSI